MLNIATILKVLGVKVTPEQTSQLEVIIPQIPMRAKSIIEAVNAMIERNDAKMTAILQKQELQNVMLQDMQITLDVIVAQTYEDESIRAAGTGAAGRLLEMRREGVDLMASSPGLPDSLEATIDWPMNLDSAEKENHAS